MEGRNVLVWYGWYSYSIHMCRYWTMVVNEILFKIWKKKKKKVQILAETAHWFSRLSPNVRSFFLLKNTITTSRSACQVCIRNKKEKEFLQLIFIAICSTFDQFVSAWRKACQLNNIILWGQLSRVPGGLQFTSIANIVIGSLQIVSVI